VVAAAAFLLLLGYELLRWQGLSAEGREAALARQRLAGEIRLRDEQLAAEMRSRAAALEEMQWTAPGGDPSAFLTRLADLAREKRMKIVAVGPLERQATPQFTKSWHTVQVLGPFREIREMASRLEGDKGILEDVRLEAAPSTAGRLEAGTASDEVQARFRMTALDLSPEARRVLDRALAAGRGVRPPGLASPPVPADSAAAPLTRDPFAFAPGLPPAARVAARAAPPPPRTPAQLELSAIVNFPGGLLAIVNNQIVKVGDVVSGARVAAITETSVTLQEPGAAPRTILLPELGAAPAPPRR